MFFFARAELKHNNAHGFVKTQCISGTGTIVDCTIVLARAGDVFNEVLLVIKNGIDMERLGCNVQSSLAMPVHGINREIRGKKPNFNAFFFMNHPSSSEQRAEISELRFGGQNTRYLTLGRVPATWP